MGDLVHLHGKDRLLPETLRATARMRLSLLEAAPDDARRIRAARGLVEVALSILADEVGWQTAAAIAREHVGTCSQSKYPGSM